MISFSLPIFVSWVIVTLLLFSGGVWVYRSYQKSKSKAVGDFSQYLLWSGSGLLIMALSYYFIKDFHWLKILVVTGGAIKTFALLFIIRLILRFLEMKDIYKKIVLRTVFVVLVVYFIFKFYTVIGLTLKLIKKPLPFMSPLSTFTVILVTLPLVVFGIWFVVKALREAQGKARLKGVVIGSGLLLVSANYAFCGAGGITLPFFANPFMVIATLIFIVGIFLPLRKEKPEVVLSPSAP